MIPINQFNITKAAREDDVVVLQGRFHYHHTSLLTLEMSMNPSEVEREKDRMRKLFWDMAYKDLREPLDELMCLARWAANSNPSAYPEVARIEELTEKINELLDWRKQLAAKQERGIK